ncbi:MAG: transposase [Prevotellaceae bacterium]|nr:transposase [Prevotellaceae bacterium]
MKTGYQWRMLPHDFPHWPAVYYYFKKRKKNEVIEEALDILNAGEWKLHKKKIKPSLGIVYSQSVKTAHTCKQEIGYDVDKKTKGCKRHIFTDAQGCLLLAHVHGATIQCLNVIKRIPPLLKDKFWEISKLLLLMPVITDKLLY